MSTQPHKKPPRSRRPPGVPAPPCSIEGCENPSFTRTFCQKHYRRWYRTGDPTKVKVRRPRKVVTWQERWDAKVNVMRSSGCHIWHGNFAKGVPVFWVSEGPDPDVGVKTRVMAHRWIWLQRNPGRRLKPAERLLRTCGNGACVNPEHMRTLTHREMAEAKQQVLATRARVDRAYRARLKQNIVDDERLPA